MEQQGHSATQKVRVRFAPSPTGHLHVGGARTALFNWLFARHHGGTFILRIEDTDLQRSTRESIDAILDNIRWLGLDWDEGPFFQSARRKIHARRAECLVEKGEAYLSDDRRGAHRAVILKPPSGRIVVDDIIHGRVEFDSDVVGDLVLMKSDGSPTYNFACVIDDAEMGISHIIRGDDHLSNTPKQLVLYRALELEPPRFAHVPLILGTDGSRLSKRHGATSVGQLREEGFLPEALVNFLALLGWSPGDDREEMDLDDLLAAFSLKRVSKKSAVFDMQKLAWLNSRYLRRRPPGELAERALPLFDKQHGIAGDSIDRGALERVIVLLGERFRTVSELVDQSYYFFTDRIEFDDTAVDKFLKGEERAELIEALISRFESLTDFDEQALETEIRALVAEKGVKLGVVMQPARVALTGRTKSPGLFEIMAILGRDRTISRLRNAVCMIRGHK